MSIWAQVVTTAPSQPWHKFTFLNNSLPQWLGLLGVLIVTLVLGKVVAYVLDRQGRWMSTRPHLGGMGMLLRCLSGPAAMMIFAGGLYIVAAARVINLFVGDQDLSPFWFRVTQTIAVLAAGWAVYRLVDIVEAMLKRWTSRTNTLLDEQLVPVIRKSLRVFVVIVLALFIAQNIFDWDVGAMIAGLGLGGLAFALAAQDALKNFFGSVTIFADRPFQLNDWVKINEHEGIVEDVGFRSTRIRTFSGHLVTIPNAIVAASPVDNIGRRPSIRRNLNITVTYDTSPEQIRRGLAILREMLDARAEHWLADRPPKVLFNDFNAASLNILVAYWYTPPDYWEFQAFNHEFNLELLQRFNEAGIEFAFPTQTLYLKQGSDLSANVRRVDQQERPQGQ